MEPGMEPADSVVMLSSLLSPRPSRRPPSPCAPAAPLRISKLGGAVRDEAGHARRRGGHFGNTIK
eukprot:scaffold17901_cov67-Isochrysis_galbana.AAC.1